MHSASIETSNLNVLGRRTTAKVSLDYAKELALVTAMISEPLARVESLIQFHLSSRHEEVSRLLQYVAGLGGKRLRPALALLSAQALNGISEETVRLATVVELVHTATLVHDDVIDNADLRRHRPTLHRLSNIHSSILVGDWLFTQAYALANEGESTTPGRWVANAAKEVCEGEIRQHIMIGNTSLTRAEYLSILGEKTGSLCGISCQLGAWSAGGDVQQCKAFHDFGRMLGTAFQVHDDWLDYWGEGQRLGKIVGSDFATGKITLPMIRLLEIASKSERKVILDCLQERNLSAFDRIKEMFEKHQIGEFTRDVARQLCNQAIHCLNSACPSTSRNCLERLAISAVERNA